MGYEVKKKLEEFAGSLADVGKIIPEEYRAFIHQKNVIVKTNRITEKNKWLLMLVASLSQKCPICVPQAAKHCLESGWTKEEMMEASMIAVLVGGSSVMTYVTLALKSIEELSS